MTKSRLFECKKITEIKIAKVRVIIFLNEMRRKGKGIFSNLLYKVRKMLK